MKLLVFYCTNENGYINHIQRELNVSQINLKTVNSDRASLPGAPYSYEAYDATDVGIPYDQRMYRMKGFNWTENLDLFIPLSIHGNLFNVLEPTVQNSTLPGTFAEFIGNEDKGGNYATRYLKIPSSVKVILVEEISCDVNKDKCEYRIRKGSFSDIITKDMLEDSDYHKASRVLAFGERGEYKNIVIFNFKREHNVHK